jgi:hypothetical protein
MDGVLEQGISGLRVTARPSFSAEKEAKRLLLLGCVTQGEKFFAAFFKKKACT